jgi:hypothetical protein
MKNSWHRLTVKKIPFTLDNIARNFPRLIVVAAHIGGWIDSLEMTQEEKDRIFFKNAEMLLEG